MRGNCCVFGCARSFEVTGRDTGDCFKSLKLIKWEPRLQGFGTMSKLLFFCPNHSKRAVGIVTDDYNVQRVDDVRYVVRLGDAVCYILGDN